MSLTIGHMASVRFVTMVVKYCLQCCFQVFQLSQPCNTPKDTDSSQSPWTTEDQQQVCKSVPFFSKLLTKSTVPDSSVLQWGLILETSRSQEDVLFHVRIPVLRAGSLLSVAFCPILKVKIFTGDGKHHCNVLLTKKGDAHSFSCRDKQLSCETKCLWHLIKNVYSSFQGRCLEKALPSPLHPPLLPSFLNH